MLEGWHEFYGLLGTAAAALVALLFVAASIGANFFTPTSEHATRTFMSPVVFHYANILFLSLIALIPNQTVESFSIIIGVASIGSIAYSVLIAVRIFGHEMADVFDRMFYGCVPVICYASGLVVAWLLRTGSGKAALDLLAAAAMALLVVNIRNAWDLMLSLSRRNVKERLAAEAARANQSPQP
jgi:hypothetical protein